MSDPVESNRAPRRGARGPVERSVVEVELPLRVSQKWVAQGCRCAGAARPKWDCARDRWTSFVRSQSVDERIVITGYRSTKLRVEVEWDLLEGPARTTETARQIVSGVVTAMQWMVRWRAVNDSP